MPHLKSLFLFPIVALIAIILVSCQENPTSIAPENQSLPSLNKFSLGAGESLDFSNYIYSCCSSQ